MKKTLKVFLSLVMLAGIFALSGCGSKKDLSKYAGTYKGEYVKMVGSDEKETEEFSVELKKDGTGTSSRDGAEYKITWSIDGENFKMTEKFGPLTIDYNGTLKDGKLDIFNGEATNSFTYEYVYNKQ